MFNVKMIHVAGYPSNTTATDKNKASRGEKVLQDLTVQQRALYLLLDIVIPWAWFRLCRYVDAASMEHQNLFQQIARQQDLRQRGMRVNEAHHPRGDSDISESPGNLRRYYFSLVALKKILGQINFIVNLYNLVNLVLFLVESRYRTGVERLLRIQIVPLDPTAKRSILFGHLKRAVSWEVITEFLLMVVPIIDLELLRGLMSRAQRIMFRRLGMNRSRPISRPATLTLQDVSSPRQGLIRALLLGPAMGVLWIIKECPKLYSNVLTDAFAAAQYTEQTLVQESTSAPPGSPTSLMSLWDIGSHEDGPEARAALNSIVERLDILAPSDEATSGLANVKKHADGQKSDKDKESNNKECKKQFTPSDSVDEGKDEGLNRWLLASETVGCSFCSLIPITIPSVGGCLCRAPFCYICGVIRISKGLALCSSCGDALKVCEPIDLGAIS